MSEARFLFRESKEVSSLVRYMQKTWQSLYFNSKHDFFSCNHTGCDSLQHGNQRPNKLSDIQ